MSTTISRFTLTIDSARSENFLIEIDGELFKVDNFILSQSLMQPNTLRFRMRKGPKEDSSEPQFKTCGSIIGKDVELNLETENFEKLSSLKSEGEKTQEIKFKGIITSISGSRSLSEYSIDVEAKSYDALLIDNPACKSFENKTLNEIVEDVVDDYSEYISAKIDSRFTDVLPYTVQYNETNYQFLLRLAQRFGEWIYNDGEHLIFGKLPQGEPVTLGYPDKDIPSYSVDMKIQHTAFSHLLTIHTMPIKRKVSRRWNANTTIWLTSFSTSHGIGCLSLHCKIFIPVDSLIAMEGQLYLMSLPRHKLVERKQEC